MKKIVVVLSFFSSTIMLAQDFNGIATYKTQRKMDVPMNDEMSDEMQEKVKAMFKKQFEKEFELQFNATTSTYKEVESLDNGPSMADTGGTQIRVLGGGGVNDVLYKNIREKRYSNQQDVFGKLFLVQDALKTTDWNLQKETKNIGEYICYKATFTETRSERIMTVSDNEDEEGTEEVINEITITAWYTPQIPVQHGPGTYWGLPGLILEVTDGSMSMLCNKLVVNPKKGLKIVAPSKGKKVSGAEIEQITREKEEEMMKRMRNGRREGQRMKIRTRS